MELTHLRRTLTALCATALPLLLLASCASTPDVMTLPVTLSVLDDGEPYQGAAKQFVLWPVGAGDLPEPPTEEELEAQKKKSRKELEAEALQPPYALATTEAAPDTYSAPTVLPGQYWLYENRRNLQVLVTVDQGSTSAVLAYCSALKHLVTAVSEAEAPAGLGCILSDRTITTLGDKSLLQRTVAAAPGPVSLDLSGCGRLTSLGSRAFAGCTPLVSVELPSSLRTIPQDTFLDCTNLYYIFIPSTISSIEGGAFSGCTALAEVEINARNRTYAAEGGVIYTADKATLVAWPAASGSVTLPEQVRTVEDYAFSKCPGLRSVTLGSAVTLRQHAFSDCTALTEAVIPASMETIEKNTFSACPALKTLTVASGNAAYKAQRGVLYSADGKTLVAWPSASGSVTVPDGVVRIEDHAFRSLPALTGVTLSTSVTEVGHQAFADCTALAAVTLRGVRSIESYAFARCTALTSVSLPATVQAVDGSAFSGCTALATIALAPENGSFSVREETPGALYSADGTALVLWPGASGAVTLPDEVRTIGNFAFHQCTALTGITAPQVTQVGHYAFARCTALQQASFSARLAGIGSHAFSQCTALLELFIPSRVVSVQENAFWFWSANQRILCQAASRPATWSPYWNSECEAAVSWQQRPPEAGAVQ